MNDFSLFERLAMAGNPDVRLLIFLIIVVVGIAVGLRNRSR